VAFYHASLKLKFTGGTTGKTTFDLGGYAPRLESHGRTSIINKDQESFVSSS
jgi:hypothetical protein